MKTKSKYLKTIALGCTMIAGITSLLAQTDSTSKRSLPEFNTIVINSPMEVQLTQGTENSVSVENGIIDKKLITEVKDNVLYIKGKSGEDLTVTFTKLNKLELLSMCDVKSTNQINSDKLEVTLKGAASDLNLDVNVKALTTSIEGAGDIKYKGTADSHSLVIKGAGDVSAYDLETNTTDIIINGTGDAKLNAKQNLTGTINGAGDITYLTEPLAKDIKINGVGAFGLKGSEKADGSDTTRLKFGNRNVLIVDNENDSTKHKSHKDKFNVYWSGVGLGINGYMNINNETKAPVGYDFLELDYAKSINVSINFLEQKIPIWKRHINLVTGMGWDISNYRFSNNYKLIPDTNYVSAIYDSSVTYKKNKLTASYLNVPLLLQLDTKPFGKHNKTVHLSGGIVGSYRIGSHTKQVYEIGDVKSKPKTRDSYNLNTWRYSAMVRVGVGKLDLYASYGLNGLFKKDQGPQVYPFTVGITLVSL